jgi:hypothetical protein
MMDIPDSMRKSQNDWIASYDAKPGTFAAEIQEAMEDGLEGVWGEYPKECAQARDAVVALIESRRE